jgi:hypothetical protein
LFHGYIAAATLTYKHQMNPDALHQSNLQQVLQSSVLPHAINLGRPKDSTRVPMTPDQLRQFAQKLPTNTHVTLLNLNYQSIGPDVLLELVGPLALLTSLQELHLAGAYALAYVFMIVLQVYHAFS